MLQDTITLISGADVVNMTVASGTSDPSSPTVGGLFYRTDLSALRVYNGTTWSSVGSGSGSITAVTGTANQITASTTSGVVTLSLPNTLVFSTSAASSISAGAGTSLTVNAGDGSLENGGALLLRGGNGNSSAPNGFPGSGGNVTLSSGSAYIIDNTYESNTGSAGNVIISTGSITAQYSGSTGVTTSSTTYAGNIIFEQVPVGSVNATVTNGTSTSSPVEVFRIIPGGGWSLGSSGTNYGSSGQVLTSSGGGLPTWSNVAITSGQVTTALGYTPLNPSATITNTLTFNNTSSQVTGIGTPVNSTDAVNKAYVDAVAAGLSWKQPVKAATTGSFSATYVGSPTFTLTNSGTQSAFSVDGYTASVGDRILIKNQTTQSQNGIYSVTTIGSSSTNWVLTRTSDFNEITPVDEINGAAVYVEQGTMQSNTGWTQIDKVTSFDDPTNGQISWAQFSGTGSGVSSITAGTGISVSTPTGAITISATPVTPSLAATQIGFGSSGGLLTSSSNLIWYDSSSSMYIGSPTASPTISGNATASGTSFTISGTNQSTSGTAQSLNLVGGQNVSSSGTAGGAVNITGGQSSGGSAGAVNIAGGPAVTAATVGGAVTISGGSTSIASSTAGSITITGGTASSNTSTAGNVSIVGGAGNGSTGTPGGNVTIQGGFSNASTPGSIIFKTSPGSAFAASIVMTINPSGALGFGTSNTTGTSGQVLTSQGSGSTPQWSTLSVVTSLAGTANQVTVNNSTGSVTLGLASTINVSTTGNAATATAITSGAANQILYQTGTSVTSFIPAPTTASTYLEWNGSAFTWAAASGGGSSAAGSLTGTTLASNVVNSSLTSVGTITTGTWNGNTITAAYGGTGQTTYSIGDILYANTTSTLAKLSTTTSGYVLTSNGPNAAPSWQASSGTSITATSPIQTTGATGAITLSLAANGVSNSYLAQMANNTVKGNVSGSAASPSDLTGTQVATILPQFSTTSTTQGLVPGSNNVGTNYFLRADKTWATVPSSSNNQTAKFNAVGNLTNATGTFRWYPDRSIVLQNIYFSLGTAGSSTITIDVLKDGVSVFSGTYPTATSGQYLSTSVVPTTTTLTTSDYLTVNITASSGANLLAVIVYQ